MTKTYLYILWAVLYAGCAALGIFNAPPWAGISGCIAFFIPPAVLLWRAAKGKDRKQLQLLRSLSLIWLGMTLVLLILNILSVAMTETAGTVLHYLLVVLPSPMFCGQQWIVTIFLWACVLMTTLQQLRKTKK